MDVKLEHTNPVQAKLKVQVPAATVNERLNSYYGSLAKRAKIPGFRPGKAPKDVVKRFYAGPETASELSERLISEYVFNAVKEKDLHIVMPPVLLATDLPEENKDFNFEVELALRPAVPKIDFNAVKVSKYDTSEASEEEVDQEIQKLRDKGASLAEVTEARPAKDQDCVVVQYRGEVDGQEREGMSADSQTVFLGQGQFLPDFEAAVLGMRVGEEKTADVKFPETYHAADLQGKTAQFHFKLLGIKEKILGELDDDFAQEVDPEVKTLAELRTKIKAQLSEHKKRIARDQARDEVGDQLVERHPFDVNDRQVQAFAEKLAEQTHHMMHQMGMPHEETEEHFKSLMESSRKKAERDVRLSYILEAIAKEQKFEVTPQDFEERFQSTAAKTGLNIAQIKSYYTSKDEESGETRLQRLKIDILDEKSLDYALSQATIKSEA